jgi:hypothetical protein
VFSHAAGYLSDDAADPGELESRRFARRAFDASRDFALTKTVSRCLPRFIRLTRPSAHDSATRFWRSVALVLLDNRALRGGRRLLPRAQALRPPLILHSFRFERLAFLVPGVVSPDLPASFAHAAAYGDFAAAILALLSLASLSSGVGIVIAWIFNIWGSVDLLNAFYQGNAAGLMAGQLGATFFIPTLVVPMLLVTHALAFRILLKQSEPTTRHGLQPAR